MEKDLVARLVREEEIAKAAADFHDRLRVLERKAAIGEQRDAARDRELDQLETRTSKIADTIIQLLAGRKLSGDHGG